MSNWNENSNPIPPRWLHCPRKAIKLIRNKFLAFKTPLSSKFDSQVPEECRFTIDMMMASLKSQKIKLGLWIDLTNTSRFYDKNSLEAYGCKYLKLQCKGHGETPTEEQTKTFVHVCKKFILCHPLEIIGVHCTHGFNRTGFFIISYLVETDSTNVDAGLKEFAIARPPGIYKADYIQELFKRYDNMEVAPNPPPRPDWCLEYDDSDVEDKDEGSSTNVSTKKRKSEINNKNPVFMAGVDGVVPVLESKKLSKIQRRVQEICSWESNGFPGSQPVSMDENNLRLLHDKPYMVSWKADGTRLDRYIFYILKAILQHIGYSFRYMMLIQENGEVHFIDRDNSVFQVNGMSFPHPENETLKDTLLDGVSNFSYKV